MKYAPIPEDEVGRLASLHALDVLDTPAEERFDRITRLAKALFQVPIALVSLVDAKRQWFKSRQGLTAYETPRDISFCGHVILGDEVFWVEDATEDERFYDNPLVVEEPKVRFYAGYPLRDRDGYRLGTLCVIDQEPRSLSPTDRALLVDIGRVAENELASLQLGTSQLQVAKRSSEQRKELIDEVSGVWNRKGMFEALRLGLASCFDKGWPATVLLGKMDQLSKLSDTWTEQGTDIILAEVAQVLRGCIRSYDSIGRIGDDQFLLLLTSLSEADAAGRVGAFQRTMDKNPLLQSIGVRMHFGYTCAHPEKGPMEIDALLAAAAESLERAHQQRSAEAAA